MKKSATLALLPALLKQRLSLTERVVQQQNTDPWADLTPACKTAVESVISGNEVCQSILDKYAGNQGYYENPFNCGSDDNTALSEEHVALTDALLLDCFYGTPDACTAGDDLSIYTGLQNIIVSMSLDVCPATETDLVCTSRCFRSIDFLYEEFYSFFSDGCLEQQISFFESDDDCKSLKRKVLGQEKFLEDTYKCPSDGDNSVFYVQYEDFLSSSKSCQEKFLSQEFSECETWDELQIQALNDAVTEAISPEGIWGPCSESACEFECNFDNKMKEIFNGEPGNTTPTTPPVGGETGETSTIGVSMAAAVGAVVIATLNV